MLHLRACRLALALGLHLDPFPLVAKGVMSEKDAKIRSYTYYGLRIYDREITVTSAGPSAILTGLLTTCKLPDSMEDEDFVSGSQSRNPSKPS